MLLKFLSYRDAGPLPSDLTRQVLSTNYYNCNALLTVHCILLAYKNDSDTLDLHAAKEALCLLSSPEIASVTNVLYQYVLPLHKYILSECTL